MTIIVARSMARCGGGVNRDALLRDLARKIGDALDFLRVSMDLKSGMDGPFRSIKWIDRR